MSGHRPRDDARLIAGLGDLARHIAWPSTPDLAGRVTAAIEAGAARPSARGVGTGAGLLGRVRAMLDSGKHAGRRVLPRSLLLALVALLLVVVVAAAIGLGVPGIRIVLLPPPSASASVVASGPPASASSGSPVPSGTPPGPEVGPSVSLAEARQMAGFGLLVPTAIGFAAPTEVHLVGSPPFGRVTFVYADGSTLTEFLGAVQPDAFQKLLGPGTAVELVGVSGSNGYWITGAPHEVVLLYLGPDGQTRGQQVTVTGNVLIWQVGSVTLRLQTPLERAAAIALAQSAR